MKNDVVLEKETIEEEIISDYKKERNERNDTSDGEKINEDNDSDDPADLLKKVWKVISPSTPEDGVTKGWYGVIYQKKKKKAYFYVGKATSRFLLDKDRLVNALELDCLKPHVRNGTALQSYEKSTQRENLFIYSLYNIIAGPIKVIPKKFPNLHAPDYQKLEKSFQEMKNLDRQLIYNLISTDQRTIIEYIIFKNVENSFYSFK